MPALPHSCCTPAAAALCLADVARQPKHMNSSNSDGDVPVTTGRSCKMRHPPPMPWFGLDIGGTLTKLVYFEPQEDESAAAEEQRRRDSQETRVTDATRDA